jgi:hypothetical protein
LSQKRQFFDEIFFRIVTSVQGGTSKVSWIPTRRTSAATSCPEGFEHVTFCFRIATDDRFHVAQQGCQMVYFQTKNPNLGKFWMALISEKVGILYGRLEYDTANLYFYGNMYGNLVAIWHILPYFGKLCQEKSGNPGVSKTREKTSSLWKGFY